METGEGDVVLIRSDETMPKTSFTVVSVVGVQWRRTPSYKDRIDGERLQLGDTVTGFEMLGVDGGRHLLVASDNPDENEKYLPLCLVMGCLQFAQQSAQVQEPQRRQSAHLCLH